MSQKKTRYLLEKKVGGGGAKTVMNCHFLLDKMSARK